MAWAVCSTAGTLEQNGESVIGTCFVKLDNDPQHRRHEGTKNFLYQENFVASCLRVFVACLWL